MKKKFWPFYCLAVTLVTSLWNPQAHAFRTTVPECKVVPGAYSFIVTYETPENRYATTIDQGVTGKIEKTLQPLGDTFIEAFAHFYTLSEVQSYDVEILEPHRFAIYLGSNAHRPKKDSAFYQNAKVALEDLVAKKYLTTLTENSDDSEISVTDCL